MKTPITTKTVIWMLFVVVILVLLGVARYKGTVQTSPASNPTTNSPSEKED